MPAVNAAAAAGVRRAANLGGGASVDVRQDADVVPLRARGEALEGGDRAVLGAKRMRSPLAVGRGEAHVQRGTVLPVRLVERRKQAEKRERGRVSPSPRPEQGASSSASRRRRSPVAHLRRPAAPVPAHGLSTASSRAELRRAHFRDGVGRCVLLSKERHVALRVLLWRQWQPPFRLGKQHPKRARTRGGGYRAAP